MKNLTPLEILQAWLNENGGELGSDEEMIEAALDAESVEDDVKIGYEEPDHSVGITGGHYVESDAGEIMLEWWDDEWPVVRETHRVDRRKSVVTRVHYSRTDDFSVEDVEEISYAVNVQLVEVNIERIKVKVIRDGRHHVAHAYRVTARYEWEAVDV